MIQTIAAAAEELTASVREISRYTEMSTEIAGKAAEGARTRPRRQAVDDART